MYLSEQIKFLLVLLFSFHFTLLIGQNSKTELSATQQVWFDYNPNYQLKNNFSLYGDIAARTVFPNDWYRFVLGPSVRYTFSKPIFKDFKQKNELHSGIRFFLQTFLIYPIIMR